jgi:hypothetical protein
MLEKFFATNEQYPGGIAKLIGVARHEELKKQD